MLYEIAVTVREKGEDEKDLIGVRMVEAENENIAILKFALLYCKELIFKGKELEVLIRPFQE